ncbi:hypothetical protein ABRP24_012470 [Curtobacterium sp. WHRI 8282]|uniref:hypothetical protein n=1 Tax=Curtobacterium sp. WHRI 8282 TaxID=3162559 RepID=UPI0032ECF488
MTTLSTRERDRRAQRVFFVVMAVVMAVADVWLHFHAGVIRPSAFWVPTVVGLVYGAVVWPLGLRQESRWWPNLVGAGFLGGFLVLIATKTFSPYAWFLAVVIGTLLFQAALPPKRSAARVAARLPLTDVRPWTGSGVTATAVERPFGKSRTKLAVALTTQDGATAFLAMELASFFDGDAAIAESANGEQLTFLTRKGVAAKSSILDDATPGMADGTLFLHSAKDESRPSAVFRDDDAAAFEQWVRTLPED